MNMPKAAVTATLPVTLPAKTIAGLVQQIIANSNSKEEVYGGLQYEEETRYFDGEVITPGRSSGYPFYHIAVVESLDRRYLSEGVNYTSVLVISYEWPRWVFAIGFDDREIVDAVRHFANELTAAADEAERSGHYPEYKPARHSDAW